MSEMGFVLDPVNPSEFVKDIRQGWYIIGNKDRHRGAISLDNTVLYVTNNINDAFSAIHYYGYEFWFDRIGSNEVRKYSLLFIDGGDDVAVCKSRECDIKGLPGFSASYEYFDSYKYFKEVEEIVEFLQSSPSIFPHQDLGYIENTHMIRFILKEYSLLLATPST